MANTKPTSARRKKVKKLVSSPASARPQRATASKKAIRRTPRRAAAKKKNAVKKKVPQLALQEKLEEFSKKELLQLVSEMIEKQQSGYQVVIPGAENEKAHEKVKAADEKIGKALKERGDDTSDDDDEDSKKPKYRNIESILRYVESPDQGAGGGVKLVIMNFND